MSNLSTYYSFNVPDINLNNQIQNWSQTPIYDATLNGDAYISTTNYKTGNGSLEMDKNTITTQGTSASFSAQSSITLHISITSDQLTILCSNYDGLIYYKTRANTSTNFSSINWTQTADSTQTSRDYYDIPVTADGSKFVTCVKNGFVYYATRITSTTGYYDIIQTADTTSRNYQGLAMTKDGNRIVACAGGDGIYFANWDGTTSNYTAFTETLETRTVDFHSIAISSNGDRIVYGDSSNNWYLSYWNGSNYNNGSKFYDLTLTSKKPRGCCFNNDASILFLSYSSTTAQEYGIYNNNTRTYDGFTNINDDLIPNSIDCRNIWCIDSSSNMTIYGYNYSSATIHYGNISYTTVNEVTRTIIRNSSFSSPSVASYNYYSTFTNWTIISSAFGLSPRTDTTFCSVANSLPKNIAQYFFAQLVQGRNSANSISIYQSIYLNKGYYELSFYYSARGGYSSLYTLTVSVGNTNIITKLISDSSLWQFIAVQFSIQTDNSYNLKFVFNYPLTIGSSDYTYCIAAINLIKVLKYARITKGISISTSGLTIACWFRSNYNLNNTAIFDFGAVGGIFDTSGIIIGHENNNIRLLLKDDNSLSFDISGSPSIITSSNNMNNNLWNHIAITMNYTTNNTSTITAYINGLTSTSNTFTNKSYPATISRPLCYLGRSNTYNTPAFFGNIDDFRIYNSVLYATDVSDLYNNTNVTNNYINSKIYLLKPASVENPNIISGLFANFDASFNVTSNASKVSNWVDVYNGVSASQATDALMPLLVTPSVNSSNYINTGSAINFASVNGRLLQTTNTSSTTNNLTLFFVMRMNSNTSGINRTFCSSLGTLQSGSVQLYILNNTISLAIYINGYQTIFNTAFIVTVNSAFILMFNVTSVGGTVGTAKYNGLYTTTPFIYSSSTTNLISNFEFGGVSADATRTFNGSIGEIIQYNRTLSSSEIILIENYLSSKWAITLSSATSVQSKSYNYYWNDPYAITNTIINKSNPYNFYYTYNNTSLLTSAKVAVIINNLVTLKLNGIIQTNMLNSGNTYSDPVTVQLINGNNLFEFITYNTGSSAYFAAYVTDLSLNHLFSTNSSTINGWNLKITGLYSNKYPVSSLIVNDSTSTAYTGSTTISTATNYRTFDSDLSSNTSCKQIKILDINLKSNNNDLANIFSSYS